MDQDIFGALSKKRATLIEHKRRLKADYDRAVAQIDEELSQLDNAISVINKAIEPYQCPHCHGSGSIRVSDAAGQMEDTPCRHCHGTGIAIT